MSRPRYQTEQDLERELEVVKFLCEKWDGDYIKLPERMIVDFALTRGAAPKTVECWLEVKCRKKKYETLIISYTKFQALHDYADKSGLPAIVAVSYDDTRELLYWQAQQRIPRKIVVGGRTDRGDWQDIEPVVHLPLHEFKFVAIDWAKKSPAEAGP